MTLPPPLVPPDVDLRGLDYMPLFGNHLFGSEFNAAASDSEWRAAVTLWWAAWNQVPAGSLPGDDAALCRLADLGRDVKTWRRLKARALHGFVACSDGRLYHAFICSQAMVAWDKRAKERQRKAKWRAGKPGQDAPGDGDKPPMSPGQGQGQGADVPANETRRDGTGRDGIKTEDFPDPPGGRAGEPPDLAGHTPTAAGAICRALRAAGIGNTNPGHPRLLALLDAGAAPEEFLGFAPSALKAGDPFAYLLGAVEGERTRVKDRATALHHGPMPVAQQPVSFRERERQAAEAQADAWGGPELAAFRRKPATNTVEVIDVDVTPKRLG